MSGPGHEVAAVEPANDPAAVAAPAADAPAVLTPVPAARLPAAAALRQALTRLGQPAAALPHLKAFAGQLVPQLQYRIARLGVAGQAGLAALVAATAVAIGALIPAYHAVQGLNADIARAQHPAATVSVEQAGARLFESLPTRAQIPTVLAQVFAQAQTAGVSLDTGHYVYTPAKSGALAHYDLEFPLKGASYPSLRTFINRTLTAVPAASLDKLHIERKTVGDQTVNADVGFVLYVRAGETP